MSDSNDNIMDKPISVLAIAFGIFNIILCLIFVFLSVDAVSIYSIFIIEGILLLISAFILSKEVNINALFFIPIIVGIGTIIIGSMNVYSNIIPSDYNQITMASEVILGGILLIVSSFMILKNLSYRKIIFVSLVFVIINIIIDSIHFYDLATSYFRDTIMVIIISIKIIGGIVILISSFVIINKKNDYKYLIFVPVIFGIKVLFFAVMWLYIKISLSFYYRVENDYFMLGLLIFSGILLITLLFRIINIFNNKIIMLFIIPFGIFNAIYGVVYLMDILSYFTPAIDLFLILMLIISILMIAESVFLFMVSYKLSIIAGSKKTEISKV